MMIEKTIIGRWTEPLRVRILLFVSKRTHNRVETMRFAVFMLFSLIGIVGMPFHFLFNWVGGGQEVLHLISVAVWLTTIVILGLYIYNKVSLGKAFFWLVIATQLLESLGLVYMAAVGSPVPGSEMYQNVIFNEMLCFIIFAISCLGLLKWAPTSTFGIFLVALGLAYAIRPAALSMQFTRLFVFIMLCVWIYMALERVLMDRTTQELNDYRPFQDSVLDMFSMRRAEMVALVQLSRQMDADKRLTQKMVGELSEQTRNNLIDISNMLQNQRLVNKVDLKTAFPSLSPSELDVCRLVLKGMSQKEIAVVMNKSQSNIGTVRGNIRRKLRLTIDDDLREALTKRING
ncbi:MAG: helix-turn-helix transcriptional regulator [Prevotella sp.]|nr:helix-turn-helix transcriptional regulator [Prevotella sp.]